MNQVMCFQVLFDSSEESPVYTDLIGHSWKITQITHTSFPTGRGRVRWIPDFRGLPTPCDLLDDMCEEDAVYLGPKAIRIREIGSFSTSARNMDAIIAIGTAKEGFAID